MFFAEAAAPPQGMPNPFAKPGIRQKLQMDPKTKDLFNDPAFLAIMDDLERNPSSLGKHLNDQRVMKCLSVLLGFDFDSLGSEDDGNSNGNHSAQPNSSTSNGSSQHNVY